MSAAVKEQKAVALFPTPAGRLNEITQQMPILFSLCNYDLKNDKLIQCHQFVKCRDFLHDVFVGVESNIVTQIFGLTYDYKVNPHPDMSNVSLLLKFPTKVSYQNFIKNLDILNQIENKLKYDFTVWGTVNFPGEENIIWVLGDKAWQQNGVAFSLYGCLLKCMGYPIKNPENWLEEIKGSLTNEAGYMKDHEKFVDYLLNRDGLEEIGKKYTNYSGWVDQANTHITTIHNYSGFCSVGDYLRIGRVPLNHVLNGFTSPNMDLKVEEEEEEEENF